MHARRSRDILPLDVCRSADGSVVCTIDKEEQVELSAIWVSLQVSLSVSVSICVSDSWAVVFCSSSTTVELEGAICSACGIEGISCSTLQLSGREFFIRLSHATSLTTGKLAEVSSGGGVVAGSVDDVDEEEGATVAGAD